MPKVQKPHENSPGKISTMFQRASLNGFHQFIIPEIYSCQHWRLCQEDNTIRIESRTVVWNKRNKDWIMGVNHKLYVKGQKIQKLLLLRSRNWKVRTVHCCKVFSVENWKKKPFRKHFTGRRYLKTQILVLMSGWFWLVKASNTSFVSPMFDIRTLCTQWLHVSLLIGRHAYTVKVAVLIHGPERQPVLHSVVFRQRPHLIRHYIHLIKTFQD